MCNCCKGSEQLKDLLSSMTEKPCCEKSSKYYEDIIAAIDAGTFDAKEYFTARLNKIKAKEEEEAEYARIKKLVRKAFDEESNRKASTARDFMKNFVPKDLEDESESDDIAPMARFFRII